MPERATMKELYDETAGNELHEEDTVPSAFKMTTQKVFKNFQNSAGQDVNPDLDTERKTASFSVERLTNILDGGAECTRIRRAVGAVLQSDPEFSRENQYFLSQNERYEGAVRKSVYLGKVMSKMGWTPDGPERNYCFRALGADLAFPIHQVFMKSILGLGTDEQIAKWIRLAERFCIVGTYAQTELGHGTYLRGLETTATFDVATQEFILNTPSISAMKWWPGDLGRSATHAVVFAQLHLKGRCHGIHPFILQIRSLQDHSPAPGITVGDIGPKMSFENVDNGFLMMKNVRVPRENMLARFSQVRPDGQYVTRGSEKINYLTMIVVRVGMLRDEVVLTLMKACTIAIRYSVVRRQSELKPGDPEAKILDYQTQQQKLLPQLATTYAFHFVCDYMQDIFNRGYADTKEGKFDLLPELHALASGIKVIVTDYSSAGVEVCRRACGGHGFSLLSGLPSLYTRLVAACTYEGENTVLLLQTARFLIKCYGTVHRGQPVPPSVAYLSSKGLGKCQAQEKGDFLNPEIYSDAYRQRAYSMKPGGSQVEASSASLLLWADSLRERRALGSAFPRVLQDCSIAEVMPTPGVPVDMTVLGWDRTVRNAAAKLQMLVQSGLAQHEAWNKCSVQLAQAAMAHSHYIVVEKFVEGLEKYKKEAAIYRILKQLCNLFALNGMLANMGDFMQDGYLSTEHTDMVTESYLDLLTVIRRDAVPLVDAFDLSDADLNSAIGSYDGHAYQRLYEWAKKSPTNHQGNQVFEKYLKPLFQTAPSKL